MPGRWSSTDGHRLGQGHARPGRTGGGGPQSHTACGHPSLTVWGPHHTTRPRLSCSACSRRLSGPLRPLLRSPAWTHGTPSCQSRPLHQEAVTMGWGVRPGPSYPLPAVLCRPRPPACLHHQPHVVSGRLRGIGGVALCSPHPRPVPRLARPGPQDPAPLSGGSWLPTPCASRRSGGCVPPACRGYSRKRLGHMTSWGLRWWRTVGREAPGRRGQSQADSEVVPRGRGP